MESNTITTANKIDHLQTSIKQFLDSKQTTFTGDDDDDNDDRRMLANLLSQLESLKGEGAIELFEPSDEQNEFHSCTACKDEMSNRDENEPSASNTKPDTEDVLKGLKKLEKQNKFTHWLLSGLILLTVAWQLSEVSLLLKVKEGVSNPFKSVGNILTGMLKRPVDRLEDEKQTYIQQNGADNPLKMAMDLPIMMMSDDQE